MNRGEIWTVAGGVYASKPRPAIIIQEDFFETTDSVSVIPLTSTHLNAPLLRIRIAATDLSGLQQASDAMIDKVTTVRRSNVQAKVGRVSTSQLVEIERALATFFGLAS